jgi:hypothetical protein
MMNYINQITSHQSEQSLMIDSSPPNNVDSRDGVTSNYFYEEEPVSYQDDPHDCGVHVDESLHLKLTESACQALIEGCDYGRKWINSDFLWELAMIEPNLWMSYEYFELYEKAVRYNWNDIISDFRDKNQSLEQFCDFFERVMRKTHGITAETDQVTSN